MGEHTKIIIGGDFNMTIVTNGVTMVEYLADMERI